MPSYKDEKIYPGAGIHVGVAVALDDGLIVPVVRDADYDPAASTGSEYTKALVKKARDKKLQPNEYSGGTFTVSNLGPFDVESFIAIIDPAQGAISSRFKHHQESRRAGRRHHRGSARA